MSWRSVSSRGFNSGGSQSAASVKTNGTIRAIPSRLSRIFEMRSPLWPTRRRMILRSASPIDRRRLKRSCRSGPKQPVREAVELARAVFEHVGQPVDDRLEQLGEDARTGNSRAVRGNCSVGKARKRGQLGKANRDQLIACQDEPDRGRQRLIGFGSIDQWYAQIERLIASAQSAGAFDLAELIEGRHCEAGCFFDKRDFARLG